jgi:hypothetical protein
MTNVLSNLAIEPKYNNSIYFEYTSLLVTDETRNLYARILHQS